MIDPSFAHISPEDRAAAVAGFARANPHMAGIDFATMIEILLDADCHLSVIGDVLIGPEEADRFVAHLAALGGCTVSWATPHTHPDAPGESGHFYEITLTRTTIEEAQVRVFIPDTVRTSDAQRAFAEAQALADLAWRPNGTKVSVSSLAQREAGVIR